MTELLQIPLTRIVLRYIAGALVALGVSSDLAEGFTASPEAVQVVTVLVGLALGAVSVWAYSLAKKDR